MTSEFSLIDQFLEPFDKRGEGLLLGPGDDCALVQVSSGMSLCTTVDAVVEGVHFLPDLFLDEEIGHKALAINLSDLAAMGARPRWFLCSVACPNDKTILSRLPGIARGMAELARRAQCLIIGGNFTRADRLSLHITAMGEVPFANSLRRDGAQTGDLLFVSGTIGGAALALQQFLKGQSPHPSIRQRQCRPEPRIELGLIARQFASAAMDISDGFLQDLGHLCACSHCGFEIDFAAIPIEPAIIKAGFSPSWALRGGEDYELLLTVPPAKAKDFVDACAEKNISISHIGTAREGTQIHWQNAPEALNLTAHRGFDHYI